MTDDSKETDQAQAEAKSDALIGYQAAVGLWAYEGVQNWALYNVMLFANSVISAI